MTSEPGFARNSAEHVGRDVDSVDLEAALTQRQREPSRTDAELQRSAIARGVSEKVDGWFEDSWQVHLR